jgi:hypothetical protein
VNGARRFLRVYASVMLATHSGQRMPGGPTDGPPSMYCPVCHQPAWQLNDHLVYCRIDKLYLLGICPGERRRPCGQPVWRMPDTDWGCALRHVFRGVLCPQCHTVTRVDRSRTLSCARGHRFRCDFEKCAECNLGYFVATPDGRWTCEAYGHDKPRGRR